MRFCWTILSAQLCFLLFPASIDSRQMCWVCQYVQNGQGKDECALAPANWTGGDNRIRCQFKCIINARFDKVTGDPTFLYRGCQQTTQEDGCVESVDKHICQYACEGENYCNDKKLGISPMMPDKDTSARPIAHTALFIASLISMTFILQLLFN